MPGHEQTREQGAEHPSRVEVGRINSQGLLEVLAGNQSHRKSLIGR